MHRGIYKNIDIQQLRDAKVQVDSNPEQVMYPVAIYHLVYSNHQL